MTCDICRGNMVPPKGCESVGPCIFCKQHVCFCCTGDCCFRAYEAEEHGNTMHFVIYTHMNVKNGPDLFGPFADEDAAIDWALQKKYAPDKGGWGGKFVITDSINPYDVATEKDELDYEWPTVRVI